MQKIEYEDNSNIQIDPQVSIEGDYEGLTPTCDDYTQNNMITL